jgi:hypothetical protein
MPKRPTKEFWGKVFPKVKAFYKGKDGERARRVTASIWYGKLKPETKARFEKIRMKRESPRLAKVI